MTSPGWQAAGYLVLAGAGAGIAIGAAGLFADRLAAVVRYSAILQGGYAALGLAAALLTGEGAGFGAALFQAVVGAGGVALMWFAGRFLPAQGDGTLPAPEGASPPSWAVFCFVFACMSLVGLPPLGGFPARVAIIQQGLREPAVLFLVTLGAAAAGPVSLYAYGARALPLIAGKTSREPRAISLPLRIGVDGLIGVLIAFGVAPYVGFAIMGALTGQP